jgi:hypothetical protein
MFNLNLTTGSISIPFELTYGDISEELKMSINSTTGTPLNKEVTGTWVKNGKLSLHHTKYPNSYLAVTSDRSAIELILPNLREKIVFAYIDMTSILKQSYIMLKPTQLNRMLLKGIDIMSNEYHQSILNLSSKPTYLNNNEFINYISDKTYINKTYSVNWYTSPIYLTLVLHLKNSIKLRILPQLSMFNFTLDHSLGNTDFDKPNFKKYIYSIHDRNNVIQHGKIDIKKGI